LISIAERWQKVGMSSAVARSRVAFEPLLAVAALFTSAAASAPQKFCEPSDEIQQEIAKAVSATPEKGTFEELTAPLAALRDRFPHDLFVHIRYQDAVDEHGIEGHLKQMADEYLALRDAHPGDLLYQYLQGRSLEGRSTRQSIAIMEGLLALDGSFAPAHRTLAEIYSSNAFADPPKAKAERAKCEELCPGSEIEKRPAPPPGKSELWSQAEELLKRPRSDGRVPDLVYGALEQDESRLQRIRPHDWYAPSYKKQLSQEIQLEYWKGWGLVVQHFWKTNQTDKAEQLLSEMRERLERWQKEPASEVYWTGATTLVGLYAQARQPAKLRETLAMMQSSLKAKPDAKRAAQLARLKARFLPRG
jgi:hypothetical protein